MMRETKRLYLLLVLIAGLSVGCSSEPANTNSASNTGQPASAAPPQNGTPQNGTAPSSAAPGDSVQTAAPSTPAPLTVKPADSAVASNGKDTAQPGGNQPVASDKAPKFVVPVMKLDFGTQKKDKTLSRSFVIKNTGNAALKIESVEPS